MPCGGGGRGRTLGYRTIHPPGRPDVYLHVAIKEKAGKRGGRTVAGKPKHIKTESKRRLRKKLFKKLISRR